MILDSVDGAYYLVAPRPMDEIPVTEGSSAGVTVSAIPDFAVITTFGSWEEVSVDVLLLASPHRQSGPFGWEARSMVEIDVSGPLRLTDMEFDPSGSALIDLTPGRFLLEVHARSRSYVEARPFLQMDDGAMEEHMVYLSPLG